MDRSQTYLLPNSQHVKELYRRLQRVDRVGDGAAYFRALRDADGRGSGRH